MTTNCAGIECVLWLVGCAQEDRDDSKIHNCQILTPGPLDPGIPAGMLV